MKLRTFSRVVASLVWIFSSVWAFAHHGTAAYEMANPTSIKGKVVEFEWANPHATIVFEAKDEKGAVRKLEVETNSPNLLHRAGWTKQTIKPGQEMTIFGFRGKDGVATFRMEKIVWPDGRETTPSNATSLKY
jgi:hypothetical protein